MKIRINEIETYEVNINNSEEISLREFEGMMQRLNKIRKVFSNEMPLTKIRSSIKASSQSSSGKPKMTRERAIEMLSKYYRCKSIEDKRLLVSSYGWDSYTAFQVAVNSWKKRYNITPKDIGLSSFTFPNGKQRQ